MHSVLSHLAAVYTGPQLVASFVYRNKTYKFPATRGPVALPTSAQVTASPLRQTGGYSWSDANALLASQLNSGLLYILNGELNPRCGPYSGYWGREAPAEYNARRAGVASKVQPLSNEDALAHILALTSGKVMALRFDGSPGRYVNIPNVPSNDIGIPNTSAIFQGWSRLNLVTAGGNSRVHALVYTGPTAPSDAGSGAAGSQYAVACLPPPDAADFPSQWPGIDAGTLQALNTYRPWAPTGTAELPNPPPPSLEPAFSLGIVIHGALVLPSANITWTVTQTPWVASELGLYLRECLQPVPGSVGADADLVVQVPNRVLADFFRGAAARQDSFSYTAGDDLEITRMRAEPFGYVYQGSSVGLVVPRLQDWGDTFKDVADNEKILPAAGEWKKETAGSINQKWKGKRIHQYIIGVQYGQAKASATLRFQPAKTSPAAPAVLTVENHVTKTTTEFSVSTLTMPAFLSSVDGVSTVELVEPATEQTLKAFFGTENDDAFVQWLRERDALVERSAYTTQPAPKVFLTPNIKDGDPSVQSELFVAHKVRENKRLTTAIVAIIDAAYQSSAADLMDPT